MRKVLALCGLVAVLAVVVPGTATAASDAPVELSGTTNVKGTKDVSASTKATVKVTIADFSFAPTFIQVQPGEVVTLKLQNKGNAVHTFTSSALKVDKTISPGKKATVKVTIPSAGGTIQFHCDFHQSMGMQGAFFTSATSGTTPATGATGSAGGAAPAAASTVNLADTRLGKVLVDANGHTLYQLDRDSATSATCTGGCAGIWPPLVASGTPSAGAGLDASKLTVVSGPNGSQVAYAGHPLYAYGSDAAAGDVNGQGVGGVWWVVGADGNKLT